MVHLGGRKTSNLDKKKKKDKEVRQTRKQNTENLADKTFQEGTRRKIDPNAPATPSSGPGMERRRQDIAKQEAINRRNLTPEAIAAQEAIPNPEGRKDLLKEVLAQESKLDPTAVQERTAQQGGVNQFEGRGERATEFVAEKALAIPVDLVGGAIKSGLEKLTGRDIQQSSAADLAETGIGKALGISIAAASGALLVATAGGALVSATSAITGKIAVALGVSKGLVVGGGALGLSGVTGLSKDIIIDKILDRKDVNVLLSTLTPMGETITNNVGLVKSGGISQAKGIAHLNAIEEDVNILDHELQQAAILDPRVSQSGDFLKIVLEIRKLRTQTEKARGDILATIPEFNAADIALALEDLQEIEKGRSSTLIERR